MPTRSDANNSAAHSERVNHPHTPQIRVCQNTTCVKAGSAKVLEAFQAQTTPGIEVVGCGCLGQCGNGPMVLVLPEQYWYSRVHQRDARAIATQYLSSGEPVESLLYPTMHPTKGDRDVDVDEKSDRSLLGLYLLLAAALLIIFGSIIWACIA